MRKQVKPPRVRKTLSKERQKNRKTTLGGKEYSSSSARQLRKERDSTFDLVIKVLICCAIIDLSIIGYFKLIKNVPVIDGLRGWALSMQNFVSGEQDRERQVVVKKYVIRDRRPIPAPKETLKEPAKVVNTAPS